MIGDRSLTAPASGVDRAASAQPVPERALRTAASEPSLEGGAGTERDRSATAEGREAARLRGLLSDPAFRVSVHEDASSGHLVMQVENRSTGEMVEQIPSERLLRLYQALRESLVDEQV